MSWFRRTPRLKVAASEPHRPRGKSLTAGLGPSGSEQAWQAKVRKYDEEGPGFVGWYGDYTAGVVGQMPTRWAERRGRDLVPLDPQHPLTVALDAILMSFSNSSEDFAALRRSIARPTSMVGECWIHDLFGDGWHVAHRPQLDWKKSTVVVTHTNGVDKIEVEHSALIRVWRPDLAAGRPWQATSVMKRAVREVDRYIVAVNGQVRPVRSRSVRNGMVAFKHPDPDGVEDRRKQGEASSYDTLVGEWVESARSKTTSEYLSEAPETMVPLAIFDREAPEWLDLGRDLDPQVMVMETRALEAFARSVAMPIQYLVEGPGKAKFANEDHTAIAMLRDDLAPTANLVDTAILSALRPTIELLIERWRDAPGPLGVAARSFSVDRLVLDADWEALIIPADRTELLVSAWKAGAIGPEPVAEALGVPAMDRPDDVTDWQQWLILSTAVGEAPVPIFEGTANDPAVTAAVEELPVVAEPQVLPLRAGVSLLDRLVDADRDSHTELQEWIAAVTAAAIVAAAKRAVVALDKTDPLRVDLKEHHRPDIEVPKLVADHLGVDPASFLPPVDDPTAVVVDAHIRSVRALGSTITDRTEVAAFVLVTALTQWLNRNITAGREWKPPRTLATDTLVVAGGALTDRDGKLVRAIDGGLIAISGERWNGGTGLATGHNALATIEQRTLFVWRRNHYGTTIDPHPDHEDLHLAERFGVDPALWDDTFPGSHAGCMCGIVPVSLD